MTVCECKLEEGWQVLECGEAKTVQLREGDIDDRRGTKVPLLQTVAGPIWGGNERREAAQNR